MKNISFLLLLIFTVSCSNKKSVGNDKILDEQNVDWLVGNWTRTNDEIGRHTFESWQKIDSDNYIGLGYTLENSDTIFKENLRIIRINNIWKLEVRGVNLEMTPFYFTKQTDTSFICENQANEFPKKIEYSISKNILRAIISDDNSEIPFIFEKLN